MKRLTTLSILLAGALVYSSCTRSDIPVFRIEDSAVSFVQITNNFSLRGMTEPERDITVKVTLIGPAADYDRPISYEISSTNAQEGVDYSIVDASVPAGALYGQIVLRVKKLPDDSPSRSVTITLLPNGQLGLGYKSYLTADVTWTESYERPQEPVWRYWWLYISSSYSREWHKFLVETFGDDIERYTASRLYAEQYSLIYKISTWWFSANHDVYEIVRKHDLENPGNPYRHSDDYERFRQYALPVGGGEGVPEGQLPPTFLETLNSL